MQIVYNAQAGGCWAEMLGGLRFSNTAQRRATTAREEHAARDAVRGAVSHKRDIADGLASMESETQAATEDALKVLYFTLRHNLPLDLFADLVELSVDLGASRLRNLHAGKREDSAHQREDSARTVEVVVG